MSQTNKVISQEGYDKIITEINQIKEIEMPDTLEVLKDARSQWDLSENSDYHAAKEKISMLKRRISELEWLIEDVEIIDTTVKKSKTNIVTYGSLVTLQMEGDESMVVKIVGTGEVDVLDDTVKISLDSPLWKALDNRKQGDIVELKSTNKKVTILSVV